MFHTKMKPISTMNLWLTAHRINGKIGKRPRPVFKCSRCKSPMVIVGFRRPAGNSG